jgi:Holliday junction DNA helicase RuvA
LASRIVNELKDKIGAVATGPAGSLPARKSGVSADALSALANLGFRAGEASAAVAAAVDELGENASLDALVRLALKKAAR